MWKKSGMSLTQLAQELGVTENRVRRAFYNWCSKHRVHPVMFLIEHGPYRNRYDLPQRFVEEFTESVKREKRIIIKGGKKYIEQNGKLTLVGFVP